MPAENEEKNEQGQNPAEIDPSAAAAALLTQREKIETLEKENAKLKAAGAKFYDAVLNGNPAPKDSGPAVRSVEDCRKELIAARERTNLEYCEAMIALHEACEREQGISCFLPQGKDVTPTADEVNTANKFKAVIKECIAIADGDPAVFNNELMRRTKETGATNTKNRR